MCFLDSMTCVLSGGGGEAAGDVVGDVGVEELKQPLANGPGSGNGVAGDFADANQIAVRRSDEDFLSGIEVLGTQRLLDHRKSGLRRDFQKDTARNSFQAAGTERRRMNPSVL